MCIYALYRYPFVCSWTLGLLPYLDSYNDTMNTGYMSLFVLAFFLNAYPGVELLDAIAILFLVFFEEPPYCFPQWLYHFIDIFPPVEQKDSNIFTSLGTFVSFFFDSSHSGHPNGYEVVSCSFDLRFPNAIRLFSPLNMWHLCQTRV